MNNEHTHLKFERKPSPVLPEHRPLYKIGQLLLILSLASRGSRSSLPRLQLFSWALKKQERYEELMIAGKTKRLNVKAWGFDPSVAISIRLAVAQKLIRAVNNGYELAEAGQALAQRIIADDTMFAKEKDVLKRIGRGITEGMVTDVAKGWAQ